MNEYTGYSVAFAFGLAYNWLVGRHEEDGLTALWVVFGVAVTLLLAAFTKSDAGRLALYWNDHAIQLSNQQHAALWCLRFFVLTGAPMAGGSLWRQLNR